MAPACFKRELVERDRCMMTSDADFFFRIGFLLRNEFVFDKRLGGGEAVELNGVFVSVCKGP